MGLGRLAALADGLIAAGLPPTRRPPSSRAARCPTRRRHGAARRARRARGGPPRPGARDRRRRRRASRRALGAGQRAAQRRRTRSAMAHQAGDRAAARGRPTARRPARSGARRAGRPGVPRARGARPASGARRARAVVTATSLDGRRAELDVPTQGQGARRLLALLPARQHRRAAPPRAAAARLRARGRGRAGVGRRGASTQLAAAGIADEELAPRGATAARRAGAHRAPDRGDARGRARRAPADRPAAARARRPVADAAPPRARRSRASTPRSRRSGRPTRSARRGRASSTRSGRALVLRDVALAGRPDGRARAAARGSRRARPAPLRLLDRRRHGRQPERRRRDDPRGSRAVARRWPATLLMRDVRALAAAWGMSSDASTGPVPELGRGRRRARTGLS